ncbi:MAG: Swt1 family HEPN domain-containing protein [Candidatus Aquilonibacter sp.]
MSSGGGLYEFALRGLLTEESLDRAGRNHPNLEAFEEKDVAEALSIHLIPPEFVAPAKRISVVYTAIAAFENQVRDLIIRTLLEVEGEAWWGTVSEKIRRRAETRQTEEQKHRFHTQRGESPINYTDMSDLGNIIRAKWTSFEPYFPSIEWVEAIFNDVERSRNVIMHSGTLDKGDIARLGIHIRDWVKQVG